MVEVKLVPVETIDRPMLSNKQLQELSNSARVYCRRRKIPIANRDVFTEAVGVLGDAVLRSLKEQGRVAPLEEETLAPLIQQGLKIREEIHEQAELAQGLAEPLAMPAQLVDKAKQETRGFVLCSHPEACEELIAMFQQRTRFVKDLTQMGLSNLPIGLQGVGLESFPNVADWVKLARNMITSFVLRDSLNPLITIDDLKSFARVANTGSFFTDNKLELLIESLGSFGEDETEFLKAIFDETAGLFRVSYSVPQEGDAELTERFYWYFGNFLLLQHPAREEEQIVTHPDLIKEGRPSLWDGASSVGGVLVPTPEMLVRADRQEEARLNQAGIYRSHVGPSNRFGAGLRAWKMFQEALAKKAADINGLEPELRGEELLLANLQTEPGLPLPKRAFEIIYISQAEARTKLNRARGYLRAEQDRKKALALEYEVATSYRDDLMQKYGNDWPDQLPIPEAVVFQRERSDKASLRSMLASKKSRLTLISRLLNLDVLFHPGHEGILVNLNVPEAEGWLRQEVLRTDTLLHSAYLPDNPQQFLQRIQGRLHYGLRDLDLPGPKTPLSRALREFSNFWQDVYFGVRDKTKASVDYWEPIWPKFTQDLLSRRIALMEMAQAVLIDKLDLSELAKRAQLTDFERQASFWSVKEARRYIRTAMASRLISIPDPVPEDWIKQAKLMLGLLLVLESKKALPSIDHPIFPKEFIGLPRADFISVWRKRCQQVLLSENLDKAKFELEAARRNFEGVCRATFMIRLMGEIESLKFRLERVQGRDPEAPFIKQMRELNLVLEEKVEEDIE